MVDVRPFRKPPAMRMTGKMRLIIPMASPAQALWSGHICERATTAQLSSRAPLRQAQERDLGVDAGARAAGGRKDPSLRSG
jgi:hypothetical protein